VLLRLNYGSFNKVHNCVIYFYFNNAGLNTIETKERIGVYRKIYTYHCYVTEIVWLSYGEITAATSDVTPKTTRNRKYLQSQLVAFVTSNHDFLIKCIKKTKKWREYWSLILQLVLRNDEKKSSNSHNIIYLIIIKKKTWHTRKRVRRPRIYSLGVKLDI